MDSAFRIGKNYYLLVILEEYKCFVQEKKPGYIIIDNLGTSSRDSGKEN